MSILIEDSSRFQCCWDQGFTSVRKDLISRFLENCGYFHGFFRTEVKGFFYWWNGVSVFWHLGWDLPENYYPWLPHPGLVLPFCFIVFNSHRLLIEISLLCFTIWCGASEATGLGFVCFVVINLCANRIDLVFGFDKFSNFTPPPTPPAYPS